MELNELQDELDRALDVITDGIEGVVEVDPETHKDIMGAVDYFRVFIRNDQITTGLLTLIGFAMKLGGTYALIEAPDIPVVVVHVEEDYEEEPVLEKKMTKFTSGIRQFGDKWQGRTTVIRDGRRVRSKKTFATGTPEQNKKAAQDWVHSWERGRAGLSPVIYQPTSLGELVEIYLKGIQGDVKQITLDGYRRLLSPVTRYFGSPFSLYLNQYQIDQYVSLRQSKGCGRVIIKELSCLRAALLYVNVVPEWRIPKKLHRIPKKESYVPTVQEFRKLVDSLPQNASLAVHMALLAGLRDEEVYRVTWDCYTPLEGTLRIPQEIRKTSISNLVPVVETLKIALDTQFKEGYALPTATGTIIYPTRRAISADLVRVSNEVGIRTWYGLQPARRLLCTLAEDCGYSQDTISLVTGHKRNSVVSRYSAASGHMELKREILENVERRLLG